MKKIFTFLIVLLIFAFAANAQVFTFDFEDEDDTVDQGAATFTGEGTTSNLYFTGANASCSNTSGTFARSAKTWNSGNAFRFQTNASTWESLNFSGCMRTSNRDNTGSFMVQASLDASSWNDLGAVPFGASGGSQWVSFSYALPAIYNEEATVYVQVVATDNGTAGTTAIRIDNAILNGNTTLPVELIDFTAKAEKKSVELNWKTASELNNEYFAIERSSNGRDFTEIGKQNGIGTSNEINTYTFEDAAPVNGVNYYRLRQVDFDGTTDYSDIVQAVVRKDGKDASLTVYPSVVQSAQSLLVDLEGFDKAAVRLSIISINGQLMGTHEVMAGQLVNLPQLDLINGVYVLRAETATEVRTAKFVVKN